MIGLFPFGETITVITRTLAAEPDTDGNDVYTESSAELANVPIWPRNTSSLGNSSERLNERDLLISGLTAVLPVRILDYLDAVEFRGFRWEVEADPAYYHSPFSNDEFVTVNLTRITG